MKKIRVDQQVKIIRDDESANDWNYAAAWYPSVGIIGTVYEVYSTYLRITVPRTDVGLVSQNKNSDTVVIYANRDNVGGINDPVIEYPLDIEPDCKVLSPMDKLIKRYMLAYPKKAFTKHRLEVINYIYTDSTNYRWSNGEFSYIEKTNLDFKHPMHKGFVLNQKHLESYVERCLKEQEKYFPNDSMYSIYQNWIDQQKSENELIKQRLKYVDDLCSKKIDYASASDMFDYYFNDLEYSINCYNNIIDRLPQSLEQSHYDAIASLMSHFNEFKFPDKDKENKKRDTIFKWVLKNETLQTSENRRVYISEIK